MDIESGLPGVWLGLECPNTILKKPGALFIVLSFSVCRLLVSASQDGKLIIWDSYTTNKVSPSSRKPNYKHCEFINVHV